jgi:hypothetical protein
MQSYQEYSIDKYILSPPKSLQSRKKWQKNLKPTNQESKKYQFKLGIEEAKLPNIQLNQKAVESAICCS